MPVEGLAFYAAATASLAAINILKSWIQELRQLHKEVNEARATLDDLMLSCTASQVSLQRWMDMWRIHENIDKHYPRRLWGRDTGIVVLSYLESLKKLLEEMRALLLSVRDEKAWKPLRIVMSVAPKLKDMQTRISTQMDTIKEQSKEAFNHKYHMKISVDNAHETLPKAQQRIFFNMAYSSRALWRGFHDSCRQAQASFRSEDLKVELDVFRQPLDLASQVGQTLRLKYAIMFPSVPRTEFNVEGPLALQPSPSHNNSESFHRACLDAKLSSTRQFFRLEIGPGNDPEWFGSSVPHAARRILTDEANRKPKHLQRILYDLRASIAQQPADIFPLSERVRFGFKVAECGFFLCGTSWLTDLKSSNIASVRDPNLNRRFLLETKASKSNYPADNGLRHFNSEAFAIGKLLIEVGIGRILRVLTPGDNRRSPMFQIEDPQNPGRATENVSADQAVAMAASPMGQEFAGSVRACLHPTRTWAKARELVDSGKVEEGYQKALEEYYINIYSPLKQLKEKADRECNKPGSEWLE